MYGRYVKPDDKTAENTKKFVLKTVIRFPQIVE